MTNIRKVGLLAAALSPVVFAGQALAFSCERHIYNNASCEWHFSSRATIGNVYFSSDDPSCMTHCTAQNGPCTIKPHCTYNIQYTYTGGRTEGYMSTVSPVHRPDPWFYWNRLPDRCPYTDHSGSTGDVYLNEPENGDYTIGGCGAALHAKKKH
ncbi:MAG TPA: hypothetical protein VGF56_09885 [Rhizomicrobium sp.]|jgi:hypothetical protein